MLFRRRARGERGAAAVEFALILPIFLMLLFGIIDFGYMINRGSMINNASRDAVRTAALQAPRSEVIAVANNGLTAVGSATVTVSCRTPANAPCGANYDAAREAGGTAVVRIAYRHKMLTPVGIFFPGGFDLTRTAEMRIEDR
ncbi:TadE/TadG family type IV pilus assembly protein [Nocardioides gilvus]|uniref:TadE/TadG family type IV pilus assembly protein n=1 Tax=Nocardioides gilvus TaxID=1735589 RepID=UPI000D74A308|nr:TadE/TadG family type IV pilus assembly protein [Nocardioides gilvus]